MLGIYFSVGSPSSLKFHRGILNFQEAARAEDQDADQTVQEHAESAIKVSFDNDFMF
jgi:hypothetical protein